MAEACGQDDEMIAKQTNEPLEVELRNQNVTNYKRTRRRAIARSSSSVMQLSKVANIVECLLFLLCLQLAGSFQSQRSATINCHQLLSSSATTIPAAEAAKPIGNQANQSESSRRPTSPLELAPQISAFDSVSLLAASSELPVERGRRQLSSVITRQPSGGGRASNEDPSDSSRSLGSAARSGNHDEAALEGSSDYEPDDEFETATKPSQVATLSGSLLNQLDTGESKETDTNNRSWNSSRELVPTSSTSDSLLDAFFSHIDKQWKFAEIVLIIAISAILNLVTIVGNIMVLISFKMDRSLQTVSNYFLLSLALADLLIGLISMPLYTLYLLLNYWPLGPLMCDIWLAIDYLNSNAAVLNMLIISFDRYFSVTRPLTYRAKRTTKHACLMISCAWLLSLTIWTPAIFTYPYYKGARTVQGTDKCEIEFVKANSYLTFVTAILAFYIPATIMIYLYWRIWLETKKRYRDLTTLFLVSGVGAAAPSRPTRPIMSAITSATVGSNAAPLKSAGPTIGALANRPRGAATRPTGQQATGLPAPKLKSSLKATPSLAEWTTTKQQQQQQQQKVQDHDQKRQPLVQDNVDHGRSTPSRNEQETRGQKQAGDNLNRCRQDDEFTITDNKSRGADNNLDGKLANGKVATLRNNCKCATCQHSSSATSHGARCHSGAVCKSSRRMASPVDGCKQCREQQRGHKEAPARTLTSGATSRSSGACYPCCCPYSSSGSKCCTASRRHEPHQTLDKSGTHMAFDSLSRASRSANCAACVTNSSSTKATNTLPSCCLIAARNRAQPEKSLSHSNVASTKSTATQQQQQALDKISANQSNSNKSIYQLISDAGHQRAKIHPKLSSSEQQVAATADADQSEVPIGFRNDEGDADDEESRERRLVDAATSPIHFSTLNLMELGPNQAQPNGGNSAEEPQAARTPQPASSSPQESCEREDFETRIVSQGDCFRFESNDPKLISASRHCKAAANRGQHEQHSWAKHQSGGCCCAEMIEAHDAECKFCRPIVKPDQHFGQHGSKQRGHFHAAASGSHQCHHSHGHHQHHHHHHHHHHHRHHHHAHHHHRHNTTASQANKTSAKYDCKKCLFQGLGQAAKHEKDPNTAAAAVAATAAPLNETGASLASLPILGALEQAGGESKEACSTEQKVESNNNLNNNLQLPPSGTARDKRTKYKKFSQKLTFSDILVDERSPSTSDRANTITGSNTDSVRNNSRRLRQLYDSGSSQEQDDSLQGRRPDQLESDNMSQSWLARYGSSLTTSLASMPLIGSLVRQPQRNRPVRYAHEQIRYRDEDLRRQHPDQRRKNLFRRLCCSQTRPIVKRFSGNESSSSKALKQDRSSSSDSNSNNQSSARQHLPKSGANNSSSKSSSSSSGGSLQPTQQHNNSNYHHHHPIQPKSERKAAKTLSTLLLVFIVTWLPYNVLVLIKTLSGGEDQVPEKIWNFSYYLCYINSTINPLCYALCNAQFRRTYMRILKCKLSNDHASSTRRMVPIQSSNTWNKDLRLNSSWATLDTTTAGSSRKSAPSEIASFPSG